MTPRSRSDEAFLKGRVPERKRPFCRSEGGITFLQPINTEIHCNTAHSNDDQKCREGWSAGNQCRDLQGRKVSFRRPAQGRRAVSSTTYALERTGRDARTVRHWMSAVNGQERNSPTQTDRSSIEPRKRRGTRHKRQPETAYSRISWCDGSGGCQVQDRGPADPSNYGKNRTAPIRK